MLFTNYFVSFIDCYLRRQLETRISSLVDSLDDFRRENRRKRDLKLPLLLLSLWNLWSGFAHIKQLWMLEAKTRAEMLTSDGGSKTSTQ